MKTAITLITMLAISVETLVIVVAYEYDFRTFVESSPHECQETTFSKSLIVDFNSSTTAEEQQAVFARLNAHPTSQLGTGFVFDTYDPKAVPEVRNFSSVKSVWHMVDSHFCDLSD